MRFAIVSDSHDNLPNIQKALAYLSRHNISTLLHCGDICSTESLEALAQGFFGTLYIVFGNGDYEVRELTKLTERFPHLRILDEKKGVEIGGKKFSMSHYPEIAKELAQTGKFSAVFYGHTHTPWEHGLGKVLVLNPGNLANVRHKATFAIMDSETLDRQLIILERI